MASFIKTIAGNFSRSSFKIGGFAADTNDNNSFYVSGLYSSTNRNLFLRKYTKTGILLWEIATNEPTSGQSFPLRKCIFYNNVVFFASNVALYAYNTSTNILTRINWSSGENESYTFHVDPSNGSIYLASAINGILYYNKFNSSFSHVWTRSISSVANSNTLQVGIAKSDGASDLMVMTSDNSFSNSSATMLWISDSNGNILHRRDTTGNHPELNALGSVGGNFYVMTNDGSSGSIYVYNSSATLLASRSFTTTTSYPKLISSASNTARFGFETSTGNYMTFVVDSSLNISQQYLYTFNAFDLTSNLSYHENGDNIFLGFDGFNPPADGQEGIGFTSCFMYLDSATKTFTSQSRYNLSRQTSAASIFSSGGTLGVNTGNTTASTPTAATSSTSELFINITRKGY